MCMGVGFVSSGNMVSFSTLNKGISLEDMPYISWIFPVSVQHSFKGYIFQFAANIINANPKKYKL